MAGYICPFCNQSMSLHNGTYSFRIIDFDGRYGKYSNNKDDFPYLVKLEIFRCPICKEESIKVSGLGEKVKGMYRWLYPQSVAKKYPDYIPEQIRIDYMEATEIIELSPKASATLARRCLQGMIRDFWNVNNKDSLYQEIEAIKDRVSPSTRRALDDIRQLGNIGAHMEQDIDKIISIDPGEAEMLLKLIEHLIEEWYVARHDTEELMEEIHQINQEKKAQKARNN